MAQDPRASEDVEPSSDENAQHEEEEQQHQRKTVQSNSNDEDIDNDNDEDDDQQRDLSTENDNNKDSATHADAPNDKNMPRSTDGDYDFEVKEQDRWLPIANVARIMKTALPDNAKIAKEAKECMQECVSEFISFITSEASEKCQQEKRKTVNGEDILFAMASLGFENYGEALKIYLARYRENMIARGEQQRPATSGGGAANSTTTTAPYDANHHPGLEGNPEGGAQFGYEVAHPGGADY